MLVDGIRDQTSLPVSSGQRAQPLSHPTSQQKGRYSYQPCGKTKKPCGIGDMGEYTITISSLDNSVIVSFFLWLVTYLMVLFFLSLGFTRHSGLHMGRH